MQTQTEEVDRFMAALDHPFKEEVQRLRLAILASNERITEHVKWNAPSFRFEDEDRVTFRLHPPDRIQLIFHRGAKVRSDSEDFAFEDNTGLLRWITNDRGVVTLDDMRDVETRQTAIVELVGRWVAA